MQWAIFIKTFHFFQPFIKTFQIFPWSMLPGHWYVALMLDTIQISGSIDFMQNMLSKSSVKTPFK